MSDFYERLNQMSAERRAYTLRALTTHLEQSGESSKLHRLLREHEHVEEKPLKASPRKNLFTRLFTRQASITNTRCVNSWFLLQEQDQESSAFISDITRASKLAEVDALTEIQSGEECRSLAFAARYALILSSMNDIGSGIAPPLIARLIRSRIWTVTQGLTYARQVPALNRRASSLAAVAAQTGRSVKDEILAQALGTVLSIKDSGKRARAFVDISPELCRSRLEQLLQAAREINYPDYRVQALIGIIPHLSGSARSEVVKETSAVLQEIDDQHSRAKAIASLAPYFSAQGTEEAMRQVLSTARTLPYDTSKVELITELATHLPEAVLTEALDAAREIGAVDRGNALMPLAARLAELGKVSAALHLIHKEAGIHSEHSLARAIIRMGPHLDERQFQEALRLVSKLYVAETRSEALVGLAPYLPERLLRKAFTIVESMKHAVHQVEPFAALLRQFPEDRSRGQFEQVLLTAMREYESHEARAEALGRMASNIPDEFLPVILSESRRIDDQKRQVKVIARMAVGLPNEKRDQVASRLLSRAEAIDSARDRFESLANLTSLISETAGVNRALEISMSIEHPDHCALGLSALFPRLSPLATDDVVLTLIRRWKKTKHEEMLPKAFDYLAPYLSDTLWQQAISFAQEKEWLSCRAGILVSLLRHAENVKRLYVLLPLTLSITETTTRSSILSESTRQLARLGDPQGALDVIHSTADEMHRVAALEAVIPHLPKPFMHDVVSLVEGITFDGRRSSVLAYLAPRVAALGDWNSAIQWMISIKNYHRHALAAARMVNYAPDYDHERLVAHALTIVRNAQGELEESEDWWQGETLSLVGPHLSATQLEDALNLTLNVFDPDMRSMALAAVTTQWLRVKPNDIYWLWKHALSHGSNSSRVNLLENLLCLTPIVSELGGPETVADTVEAIFDVGDWWPA